MQKENQKYNLLEKPIKKFNKLFYNPTPGQ